MVLARVTWIEVPPADLSDEVLAIRARVLHEAQASPGFRGALDLVDRATGRQIAVTLWEDETALRGSERALRPNSGAGGPRVEAYEATWYGPPSG